MARFKKGKPYTFSDVKRFVNGNKKAVFKALLVAVLILGTLLMRLHAQSENRIEIKQASSSDRETVSDEKRAAASGPIYVDISGEVNQPGVYKVSAKTRLYTVIEKAGGLKEGADLDSINRASFVKDGDKIIIPSAQGDGTGTEATGQQQSSDGKIDINNAGKDELMKLPGVGEVIAERIMEYRAGRRFRTPEDLKNVNGIGDATYKKMESMVKV